jgi:hypothetical protein
MLHEFLTSNRTELITRCQDKAAKRFAPSKTSTALDHGVPLFLQQLVEILRHEQQVPHVYEIQPVPTPAQTEVGRAAAVHGADMLRLGYTIDQVVHYYGDVCQSVTQLAGEQKEPISVDEFRTLNRCLDDAIADAVTAFGSARQTLINDHEETLEQRMSFYLGEHKRLADIALQSYTAIRTGQVGVTGSTGTLLLHTLEEVRTHAERTLAHIRLACTSAQLPIS